MRSISASYSSAIFTLQPSNVRCFHCFCQLDEANEEVLLPGGSSRPHAVDRTTAPHSDPWAPLKSELAARGLLTARSAPHLPLHPFPSSPCLSPAFGPPRINAELESGERYWGRERLLCGGVGEVSWDDAVEGLGWKSFDYRVLNLLLYGLRGVAGREEHLQFLRLSETLVEISDDLSVTHSPPAPPLVTSLRCCPSVAGAASTTRSAQHASPPSSATNRRPCLGSQEDVMRNSFNILRLSCRVYGPEGGPRHLARYISDVEQQYAEQLKELDECLAAEFTEQCQEASRIGGRCAPMWHASWMTILPLL